MPLEEEREFDEGVLQQIREDKEGFIQGVADQFPYVPRQNVVGYIDEKLIPFCKAMAGEDASKDALQRFMSPLKREAGEAQEAFWIACQSGLSDEEIFRLKPCGPPVRPRLARACSTRSA